ncbi:MAG: sugar ABC transporter ATP-binding protein [Chloroflexi bacterium RBG_16_72_14]|nr:MAG: sugar ABC transporter ATP-binding protein [Chloroflexi bacterium RBG_16_72_14]
MNPEPQVTTPTAPGPDPDVVMRAEGVTKVFPGTTALDDVTLDVHRAMVNVLIGENGAGKSTLMKILAGVEQPTSGRVLLDGEEVRLASRLDAARLGIGIIYQELNLCPNLSVVDNIFLAREVAPRGVIDRRRQRAHARSLIERLEQRIDPDTQVGMLRVGQQQIVEIARALAEDVRVLIMDEPTSALSAAETEVLFRIIRDLKAHGVTIIYISHKLDELLGIGDRITVLRDGRMVAHADAGDVDVSWIIGQMVGRDPSALFTRTDHPIGEIRLRVRDVTLPRVGGGFLLDHVSFDLHAGEILGIYGLMGAGRTELLECLAGVRPESTGEVRLDGLRLDEADVADRIEAGIVLVPEDRQSDGLVPTLSVAHNMLLASLKRYLRRFWLVPEWERQAVERYIGDLSIRVSSADQPISSLSGGNQQKVVVAKGLMTAPRILLLDEPTRGIDVGAKSEIFQIMSRLAEGGYGIVFVSSELKEVMAMSDRVLVLSKGAIAAQFERDQVTEEHLVAASAAGYLRAAAAPAPGSALAAVGVAR